MGKLMFCPQCDAAVYAYPETLPDERPSATTGVWVCGVCGHVLDTYPATQPHQNRHTAANLTATAPILHSLPSTWR